MITKIISGGQTGADLGGLKAAKELGIPTGGFAPTNFITELGPNLELRDIYKLADEGDNYITRTEKNVKVSDATVIFAQKLGSAGTKLTLNKVGRYKKYVILNPLPGDLRIWLETHPDIKILNIAGNRASVDPGAEATAKNTLLRALDPDLQDWV